MRLIDADELKKKLEAERCDCEVIQIIDDMPTAAEPMKHAYWECGWICSNCQCCNGERGTDYCPYCGARMDGDDNDKSGEVHSQTQ